MGILSSDETALFIVLRSDTYLDAMPNVNLTVLGLLSAHQPPLLQRLIYTFAGRGDEQDTGLQAFRWKISGTSLARMEAPMSFAHAFQIGVAAPGEPECALGLTWNDPAGRRIARMNALRELS